MGVVSAVCDGCGAGVDVRVGEPKDMMPGVLFGELYMRVRALVVWVMVLFAAGSGFCRGEEGMGWWRMVGGFE